MTTPTKSTRSPLARWLPVGIAVALALIGYYGPWIPHRAAGLIIPGLDMGEVVKFIPEVIAGQIQILREAFYTPLFAGSLIATFIAGRRSLPWWLRLLALLLAAPLALAMLPPGWTPGLLLDPAFRLQVFAIAACLLAIPLVAVTRFLPDGLLLAATALLALSAGIWPAWSFWQVLPPLRTLYQADGLLIGWGFGLASAGWLAAGLLALLAALPRAPKKNRTV